MSIKIDAETAVIVVAFLFWLIAMFSLTRWGLWMHEGWDYKKKFTKEELDQICLF